MRSFRATATIMVVLRFPAPSVRSRAPFRQGALLLEPQEPPSQLHEAASDPRIAGLGQTLSRRLAPLSSGEPVTPA